MTTQITRFSLEDFRDLALSWMEANGFQPVPGEPPSWDFQVLTGGGESIDEKHPVLIVPTVIQPRWTTAIESGVTPPSYEVLKDAAGLLLTTRSTTPGIKAASSKQNKKVGKQGKSATDEEDRKANHQSLKDRRAAKKEASVGMVLEEKVAVVEAAATPSGEPPRLVPTDDSLKAQTEPAEEPTIFSAVVPEEEMAGQEVEEEVAGAEVARETFRA